MTDEHDRVGSWVAAYTLGALDAADRRTFEAHLDTCPRCAAELASLAPLPALIGRVERVDVEREPDPRLAREVAAGAVREVRTSRRRAGRRRAAVLAVVAAAAIVVVATWVRGQPAPEPSSELATITDSTAGAAEVTVSPRLWGTEIGLAIAGLPQRGRYQLWAVDYDGSWTLAATWGPTPTGDVRLTGACPTALAELDRIVITSDDKGDLLVDARPA